MKYKYVTPFQMDEGYPAAFTVGKVYENVFETNLETEALFSEDYSICLKNDDDEEHFFDGFDKRDWDGFSMADHFEQLED